MGAGIAVVAASSRLAGLSQSFAQLLVLRGVGGLGSAMFSVSAQALLLASVPAPGLRSFLQRLLRPLTEYDARHNAELLPTLRSFLACDGSWSACASRMYVHVHTLRYRIARVEALPGLDLSPLIAFDGWDELRALRAGGAIPLRVADGTSGRHQIGDGPRREALPGARVLERALA